MLRKIYRALGAAAWGVVVLSLVGCFCKCYYYRVLPDYYDGLPVSWNLDIEMSVMGTIILVGVLLVLMGIIKCLGKASDSLKYKWPKRSGTEEVASDYQ